MRFLRLIQIILHNLQVIIFKIYPYYFFDKRVAQFSFLIDYKHLKQIRMYIKIIFIAYYFQYFILNLYQPHFNYFL